MSVDRNSTLQGGAYLLETNSYVKIFYLSGSDPNRSNNNFFLFTYSDLLFFFLPIRFLLFSFYLFGSDFFLFFSFYLFGSFFFLFTYSDPLFSFLFIFTFPDHLFHLFTFSDRQNDRKRKNIPFDRTSLFCCFLNGL